MTGASGHGRWGRGRRWRAWRFGVRDCFGNAWQRADRSSSADLGGADMAFRAKCGYWTLAGGGLCGMSVYVTGLAVRGFLARCPWPMRQRGPGRAGRREDPQTSGAGGGGGGGRASRGVVGQASAGVGRRMWAKISKLGAIVRNASYRSVITNIRRVRYRNRGLIGLKRPEAYATDT